MWKRSHCSMSTSEMSAFVPKVKFNNGREYPILGLGTWKSTPDVVYNTIKDAIDVGYRHIDCAPLYENEKEIGAAIANKIIEGVVTRDELYITTKLWCTNHRPGAVEPALRASLKDLGLDYIDLYLIHWPFAFKEGPEYFPYNSDNTCVEYSDADYVDTWKAMEEIYQKGLAKSIGVSNFNKRQLERVLEHGSVVPVVNQVESSPHLNQNKLLTFCKSKGIKLIAYSPLGSPDRPNYKPGDPKLLDDLNFETIGRKYGKTPAQICLKYQVQRGVLCIPKSVSKERLTENINIFDFDLSDEDMAYLDGLDCNARTCMSNRAITHKHHPFINDEY